MVDFISFFQTLEIVIVYQKWVFDFYFLRAIVMNLKNYIGDL